jgi:hypothetical protein
MPRNVFDHPHTPDGPLPDISQLITTRLKPRHTQAKTHAQQITQHEAEIRRLSDLAAVVGQAVTALIIRMHTAMDQRQQEALDHSRTDLQRFKDELESLLVEHQRTIERLHGT